jgi:hypothetical protein
MFWFLGGLFLGAAVGALVTGLLGARAREDMLDDLMSMIVINNQLGEALRELMASKTTSHTFTNN